MSLSSALVTIGVTCFNAANTVLRALESALVQDWPNFEVVIVDDLSTDNSTDKINAAIVSEPRARLIRHSGNLGPGAARNTILSKASGEFVAFFDDDDESLPGRITAQVDTLSSYEQRTGVGLIACYASGIRRYPNGYSLPLPAIGSRGVSTPSGPGLADYLLSYRRRPGWFYGSGTPTCSLLARRSTFAAVGGFDPALRRVEDADFAIRLALMGGHFVGTRRTVFVQYSTSAADKSPERNLEAHQHLVWKHKNYLQSIGRFEYARRWHKLRYWHFSGNHARFFLELMALLMRHPFAVTRHLFTTGPRRFWHERRMRGKGARALY